MMDISAIGNTYMYLQLSLHNLMGILHNYGRCRVYRFTVTMEHLLKDTPELRTLDQVPTSYKISIIQPLK